MYSKYIYVSDFSSFSVPCSHSDLDLAAMRALGLVLNGLVLQPKEMTGDIFEQKGKLFQKYLCL